MATSEPFAHVEQLSLYGLLCRLDLVEKMKEIKSPTEEEKLVIASEGDAKKAVIERLSSAGKGLAPLEQAKAKEFLHAQVKSVEPGSKNAAARVSKLRDLLTDVESAPSVDEALHIRSAKADLTKAEKAFNTVHQDFERWEKGKKMLSVDDLNILKRSHEDLKQRVDVLKAHKDRQIELRAEAAEPAPTTNKVLRAPTATGQGKAGAKAPNAVHGGGPAVRTLGTSAPSAKSKAAPSGSGYPTASAAQMRQAQMVAQVREEAEAAAPPPEPKPARVARGPKVGDDEDQVVLSYECTVAAVREVAGISQDDARAMATSSKEYRKHFDNETWGRIKERSQAIERERKEKEREAERKKQAAALARAEARQAGPAAATPQQAKAQAAKAKPKPKAPPPGVAAQPKPKGDPGIQAKIRKQQALLSGLENSNPFGGLVAASSGDEDSDGPGWTAVGR